MARHPRRAHTNRWHPLRACRTSARAGCSPGTRFPDIHRVDRTTKLLSDGRDYRAIAPLGTVPVISLPDGSLLSESVATPELKAWARANATATLDHIARHLAHHDYLVGGQFSVADAYMFWGLLIAPHGGIPLDAHPAMPGRSRDS